MTPSVWIIDDDKSIRWVLEKPSPRRHQLRQLHQRRRRAECAVRYPAQVILSDIRMPGTDGLKFLATVKAEHPYLPVIVMTAHSDLDSAVAAFQAARLKYLPKPFDVDQAVQLVERALGEARATTPARTPWTPPGDAGPGAGHAGRVRAIGRLSQSSVTVLITGESGGGKELVAHALHRHSNRAAKAFIAINTAAIPRDLLESSCLATSAARSPAPPPSAVAAEEAEGGTLFLDEIGDMPSTELQTRLLRVLSDGFSIASAAIQPIKGQCAVIAATHQNLEDRVKQGLFAGICSTA